MAGERSGSGEAPAEDDLLLRRKRALYRAQHRGTKEMDWMVGKYAEAHLFEMTPESLMRFEKFLEVGDTEIHNWLFGTVVCEEPQFAPLVDDIRGFNSLS
jgi:antitoxin CptB